MNIITIDVGTMSLKSSIFNEEGINLKSSSYEYSAEYLSEGWVEQDPNDWKESLHYTLGNLSKFIKEEELEISAISVTSQRASVIPVNKNGTPLYNAVTWQDKRSIQINDRLLEKYSLDYFYQKTGLRSNPYFSLPKMIWFKEQTPLIYSRTHKLLGVQDYIVHLLTGEFKTDATQAARTMLMNIETFEWDEELLEISGIEEDLLCELLPPGSEAGKLLSDMATKYNLSNNIPVIMAGGDQQNAALALNVLKTGKGMANTGTGSFVISHSDEPVFEREGRVLCSASAVPGQWILETSIFNTGSIYRWLKNEFYEDKDYNFMNQEAESAPIGSNGVLTMPHFEGSAAPFWNPYAKGLFFNLSLGTKRSDITRSVLEGISLEISNNISLIENVSEYIDEMSVAGGLTNSELFNQIQSDTLFKPIVKYEDSEASSLGATMSAFVTLKVFNTYEEAFEGIVGRQEQTTYNPNTKNHLKYNHVQSRKLELYDVLNKNDIYQDFMDSV